MSGSLCLRIVQHVSVQSVLHGLVLCNMVALGYVLNSVIRPYTVLISLMLRGCVALCLVPGLYASPLGCTLCCWVAHLVAGLYTSSVSSFVGQLGEALVQERKD